MAEIKKLKKRRPQALLSVEDMAAPVYLASLSLEEEGQKEDETKWEEDESDEDYGSDMVYIAREDATGLDASLNNAAFIDEIY